MIALVLLLAVLQLLASSAAASSVSVQTDCLMRQLAMEASNALLPRCRVGDQAGCQLQINQVAQSLSVTSTGASKCQSLKTPQANLAKIAEKEESSLQSASTTLLYVSPTTGKDTQAGTSRAQAVRTVERALALAAAASSSKIIKRIHLAAGEHIISSTLAINQTHNNVQLVGEHSSNTTLTSLLDLTSSLQWKTHTTKIVKATLTAQQAAQLDTLSQLFVNGQPAIRARYPNTKAFTSFAYSTIKPKSWTKGAATKTSKIINRDMAPKGVKYMPNSPAFNRFSLGFHPSSVTLFSPPASYFLDSKHHAQGACRHSLPTGVTFKTNVFAAQWKQPTLARFHAQHWYSWGAWAWHLKSHSRKGAVFGPGGWQEARGDCGKGGGRWFVDNALELVDASNEFFLDLTSRTLYYQPASTATNPAKTDGVRIELGRKLVTLLSISKASNVSIANVQFRGGYEVTMKPFEVPSGGDWSLHRSAALFISNSSNVLVEDNQFVYNAGNALFVNGASSNVIINRNDFYATGASCVLVGGDPDLMSADPWRIKRFPVQVMVRGNVMRNFGLAVKQSSGVFISLAQHVTAEGNVVYNGPRAGITINDQFGGGHQVKQNLVFEQTLETSDNGPFIMWHRQMYEGGEHKLVDVVEGNFLLGSAGLGSDTGGKGINVDDGAFRVKSLNNVVVWGFQKIKGAEVEVRGNLIVNPISTSCVYFSYYTRTPSKLQYNDNTCVTSYPPYAFGIATNALPGVCSTINFQSAKNTFYYDGKNQKMENCAKTWSYWTKTWKQDSKSVYSKSRPSAAKVGDMVRKKLPWI